MSKERLERIEYSAERTALLTKPPQPLVTISDSDFEWLIEQAERVQELEQSFTAMRDNYEPLEGECNKLEKQNKRYREALEFYADTDNYKLKGRATISSLVFDGGIRARKALEESE